MVLGMGSKFHLFPHGTSLHSIHCGEVLPMGMWHEKLIPGESSLWFPSKSYPREEDGVHWQVAHYSPTTDVNSMQQNNLPFILETRTRDRPGWISGCQVSQKYLCHKLSIWHQETQLPLFLYRMEDQSSMAQDRQQNYNSTIYTWPLSILGTSRKSLPEVYYDYRCSDEEPWAAIRPWFGQSLTGRWWQNWKQKSFNSKPSGLCPIPCCSELIWQKVLLRDEKQTA